MSEDKLMLTPKTPSHIPSPVISKPKLDGPVDFIIRTRHDVSESDIKQFKAENKGSKLHAYAPDWVKDELRKIWPQFAGKKLQVVDAEGRKINTLIVPSEPSIEYLQILARNEEENVTGIINSGHYNNYKGVSKEAVLTLKDLVKHCILVAKTQAVAEGGYRSERKEYKNPKDIFIIDLIGAQFQQPENYGRHLVISETPMPAGQVAIYERLTGHKPPSYAHIKRQIELGNDNYSSRYIPSRYWSPPSTNIPVYFDTYAYDQMVSQDFYLSALAANEVGREDGKEIDFRFLAYGTGFFAGNFKGILGHRILEGVLQGLKKLADNGFFPSQIKRFTFPHYLDSTESQRKAICEFCKSQNIDCVFNKNDAFYQEPGDTLTIAASNTADPHAVAGNEGGKAKKGGPLKAVSVDAAFACNLAYFGMGLDPKIVDSIIEQFIKIPSVTPPSTRSLFEVDYYQAARFVQENYLSQPNSGGEEKGISKGSLLSALRTSHYDAIGFLAAQAKDQGLSKFCVLLAHSPERWSMLRVAMLFAGTGSNSAESAENMVKYFREQELPEPIIQIFSEALAAQDNPDFKPSCPEASYLHTIFSLNNNLDLLRVNKREPYYKDLNAVLEKAGGVKEEKALGGLIKHAVALLEVTGDQHHGIYTEDNVYHQEQKECVPPFNELNTDVAKAITTIATVPKPIFAADNYKVPVTEVEAKQNSWPNFFGKKSSNSPTNPFVQGIGHSTKWKERLKQFKQDTGQFLYDTTQSIQLMSERMSRADADTCTQELREEFDSLGGWGLAVSAFPSSEIGKWRVYINGDPEVIQALLSPKTPQKSVAETKLETPQIKVPELLKSLSKSVPTLQSFNVQLSTWPREVVALSNAFSIPPNKVEEVRRTLKEHRNSFILGSGIHLTLTTNSDGLYQVLVLGNPSSLQRFVCAMSELQEESRKPSNLIESKYKKETYFQKLATKDQATYITENTKPKIFGDLASIIVEYTESDPVEDLKDFYQRKFKPMLAELVEAWQKADVGGRVSSHLKEKQRQIEAFFAGNPREAKDISKGRALCFGQLINCGAGRDEDFLKDIFFDFVVEKTFGNRKEDIEKLFADFESLWDEVYPQEGVSHASSSSSSSASSSFSSVSSL